ncbi:3-oxoadipate enol-lactonase [Noviherbaspirillum massiliense]|uniref:3-oxoadipate enol-lactonase n=1 Tax=Noviherbaspirillum massiliense TaxID=1465823 RepID=UPI0002F26C77|nr:3-oxoadipate enol-lactonase [Noviherbaspirillum massiliense]
MPIFEGADVRLHYEIDGPEDKPWLVLSNSLGTTLDMWTPQMPALAQHFHLLRYDTRGHGASSVPPGPYSIDQLGRDVIALMDGLGIARAHFCGLSMGGMTGIWLGIHQAARIDRLALCNTAARIGTPEVWNARIDKVRSEGMAAIVPAVLERWFTPGFAARTAEQVEQVRAMLLTTDPAGYAANCAVVRDMDQRDALGVIKAPVLVITGTHDTSTPPAEGKWIADRVAGARHAELDAAHLSNWEQPEQFTRTLLDFLSGAASG